MAIPRFFVDAPLAVGTSIELPAPVAHHATQVLRLRSGDELVVFNGTGGEFHARLSAPQRADLLGHDAVERESGLAITLVQSWIATDKLDWAVEKAVELGVDRIVLAPARRSVIQLEGARLEKRLARLRETIVAACCQCGRNRIPALQAARDIADALAVGVQDRGAGAWLEPQASQSLAAWSKSHGSALAIAVGPEGGFDDRERALAERAGYQPARLGPRVLRTESAGIAALVVLQATRGDLG